MSNPIEDELRRAGAGDPRSLAGPAPVDPRRLGVNRAGVDALLLAPSPSWLERLLSRLGVGEAAARLVTATPGLRRAWLVAVLGALLFAFSVASSSTDTGPDRIVTFLTVAPLVPLLGVALAFGSGVDPTNETLMAAPIDGFRVFVLRAITVLVASITILGAASLLVPDGGWHRVAWLFPALAVTLTASALSSRLDPRRAATVVGVGWLALTLVIVNVPEQPSDAFGLALQFVSVLVAAAAAAVLVQRRSHFDIGVAGR
ncbi:MAG: zf-HC2 domain-containing protein [Acidimicrobiia bacterium]|nr:zf-HC2 domain-containing protein [Acidimicrobiia bacterium]